MPEQFPHDGEGLPTYAALDNVGLDPVLVAQANALVGELSDLVSQQQDKVLQTQIDLAKLKSLIGVAEKVANDIIPVVLQIAERYAGSRVSDLCSGPMCSLLKQPAIQELGQDVLAKLIGEIRNKTGIG